MDTLEEFLSNHTNESTDVQETNEDEDDHELTKDVTFGDKLGYNEQETLEAIKSSKRFEKTLENRYYNSMSNNNNNPSITRDNASLLHRIESYKYKKTSTNSGGAPLETKIHNTPLSYKAKFRNTNDDTTFESRDPRFSNNVDSNESGWKLRNAYKFLDDMIDRDINIIKKQIKRNKKQIKYTKKNSTEYNKDIEIDIKKKGATVNVLKKELITLQNRQNRIQEKDLEQQSKSEMRKMEIDQVRKGIKTPYHHNLKRTRFGQVKFVRNNDDTGNRTNIQNVYLHNKYDRLKKDGKLERYMKKKTKRVNSKFRAALQKKSGRGWNDSV